MKKPLVRLLYGTRIDLPTALIAETTLGIGSEVDDSRGRTWKRMGRGDWMTPLRPALPALVDVVQANGVVTVRTIHRSELQ